MIGERCGGSCGGRGGGGGRGRGRGQGAGGRGGQGSRRGRDEGGLGRVLDLLGIGADRNEAAAARVVPCIPAPPPRPLGATTPARMPASEPPPGPALVAVVDPALCSGCGVCLDVCPSGAPSLGGEVAVIDPSLCLGCGACVQECPSEAIHLPAAAASG